MAKEADDEPEDPIEASDSPKPTGRWDRRPSGEGVWLQRTETSLAGLGGSVRNPGPENVRLKEARGERGATARLSWAAQRLVGGLTAIICWD